MESEQMSKKPAPAKKISSARQRKKRSLVGNKEPVVTKAPIRKKAAKKKNLPAPKPPPKRALSLLKALALSIIPQGGLNFEPAVVRHDHVYCVSETSPLHPCFVMLTAYDNGDFKYEICFGSEQADAFRTGYEELLQCSYRNVRLLSSKGCQSADANKIARNIMRVFDEYLIMREKGKQKARKARKKAEKWAFSLSGTEKSPHCNF